LAFTWTLPRLGLAFSWSWAGFYLDLGCLVAGLGLAFTWTWVGFYLDLGWLLPGLGLAFTWTWVGFYLDFCRLLPGLGVGLYLDLGWLVPGLGREWHALPGAAPACQSTLFDPAAAELPGLSLGLK
jgi:hypothetical protein